MPGASREQQSLILTKPRQLEWVETELPPLGPSQLRVRTIAGAISMGTEIPLYAGTHRAATKLSYPMMTGYESLAEVVEIGTECKSLKLGDRIVSFYGHRTAAVIEEAKAIPIPKNISDKLALLSILFSDVSKGISKLKAKPSDQFLVTGAGTVGLLTVFALKTKRFEDVDISEPLDNHLKLANQRGARFAATPEAFQEKDTNYDIGIECSSNNEAFQLMQQKLKPNGQICVLSDGNLEPLTLSPDFHGKELAIVGSSDSDDYSGYANAFFQHTIDAQSALESIFDFTCELRKLPNVFEAIANCEIKPIKVFVKY